LQQFAVFGTIDQPVCTVAIYTELVLEALGYEYVYPSRCGGKQWAEKQEIL